MHARTERRCSDSQRATVFFPSTPWERSPDQRRMTVGAVAKQTRLMCKFEPSRRARQPNHMSILQTTIFPPARPRNRASDGLLLAAWGKAPPVAPCDCRWFGGNGTPSADQRNDPGQASSKTFMQVVSNVLLDVSPARATDCLPLVQDEKTPEIIRSCRLLRGSDCPCAGQLGVSAKHSRNHSCGNNKRLLSRDASAKELSPFTWRSA